MHVDHEHRDLGVLEGLHVGGVEGHFSGGSQDEIDVFLVRDHFLHIIFNIHKFIGVVGVVADQRQEGVLVVGFRGEPLFKEKLKLVVPLQIALFVPLGLLGELFEDPS